MQNLKLLQNHNELTSLLGHRGLNSSQQPLGRKERQEQAKRMIMLVQDIRSSRALTVTNYLLSSPSSSFLYVAISMSRASLTFMSSWYWRTCSAISCLALWRASSKSLMRSLASFTASSPRSSASAIWVSKLLRWVWKRPNRGRHWIQQSF